MVKTITLLPFDAYNQTDLDFAYETMEYRWNKKDTINIKYKTSIDLPNRLEAECIFRSEKIKHIYNIYFGFTKIGIIFIDIDDNISEFLLPKLIKKAIKKYRQDNPSHIDVPLSALIHMTFFKKHPEITRYYASANPFNSLSINAMIKNGYEPIEIIYSMATENGIPKQGPWKDYIID